MKSRERGFITLEVVMAIAIFGLIMGGALMTTMTLMTNPQRSNNMNIILNQIQSAGYAVSQDVQMAKSLTLGEPTGFPLTLVIPVDINPDNDYSVSYFFDGNNLKRQVTGFPATVVAKHIDEANTSLTTTGSTIYSFIVNGCLGESVVERSFEISTRVDSS